MPGNRYDKQKTQVALGLCRYCREPNLSEGAVWDRCFRHGVQWILRNAGLARGVLSAPDKKRRENLTGYLRIRFDDVLAGRELLNWDEALQEAFKIRDSLDISWGGTKGVVQTAKVIQVIERMAAKRRPDAPV